MMRASVAVLAAMSLAVSAIRPASDGTPTHGAAQAAVGAEPLRAGFARADITPPPGVGLAGDGPEGSEATGQRLRLYARVLVLEDSSGNRLALVAADLPLGSAGLQRRVADSTKINDGIDVDRLIISVTHTHSGPSHYFDSEAYNTEASSVVGYDSVMLDSLAGRIAHAIHAAAQHLHRARAAWGTRDIWGVTRIRSMPALLRNVPLPVADTQAPATLTPEYKLVNPRMTMLRVDREVSPGVFKPAGAYSIFAMHATGNPTGNELLDPDISGIVERRLERHIDSLVTPDEYPFVPHGYSLVANGTEGDVSPAWTPQSRCDLPKLRPFESLQGPFGPDLWQWKPPSDAHLAACTHAGRDVVEWIGGVVGSESITLFNSLGAMLSDRMELARAFTTLDLPRDHEQFGICAKPAIGMSALVGADDAHTRVNGMRLFGIVSIGLTQGPDSPNGDPSECQAQKHQFLDVLFGPWLNDHVVSKQFPSHAELTLFRIGDRVIATVPGEVTTTAGRRMRAEILDSLRARGSAVTDVAIVGLTDGYMEYITTAEEYTAQYYEGGSTLYGPGEAAMFGHQLAKLVGQLSHNDPIPPSSLAITINPGSPTTILKQPNHPERERVPTIGPVWCSADTLHAAFTFGTPHDWAERDAGAAGLARVEVLSGNATVAWDDDPAVELHLMSFLADPAKWELRWSRPKGGLYVVRLRGGVTGKPVDSSPIACGHRP